MRVYEMSVWMLLLADIGHVAARGPFILPVIDALTLGEAQAESLGFRATG